MKFSFEKLYTHTFLFLFMVSIILYHILDRFKLIYTIPFLLFPFQFFVKKESKFLFFLGTFIAVFFLSLISSLNEIYWSVFIRDILIISSPLFVFVGKCKFEINHIVLLLITAIVSYFIWPEVSFQSINLTYNLFSSNDSSSTEYHLGPYFGLFLLFFLFEKKYFWAFLSLIMILLIIKRTLWLAVIISIFVYVILSFFREKKIRSVLAILFVFLCSVIAINIEFILGFGLESFLDEPLNVDQILTGRLGNINFMKSSFDNGSIQQKLFGHGAGQSDIQISKLGTVNWANVFPIPTNPHNDWLKILFDYGLVGYVGLLSIIFILNVNYKTIPFIIYTALIMITENPLVYVYYFYTYYIILNYYSNFYEQKLLPNSKA